MSVKSYIPPIDESEMHAARAMYMGGWEQGEIVERLKCNPNTLRCWVSEHGWYKERLAINAERNRKNPPENSPMMKVFAPDKKAENVKIFQEKTGEIAKADAEHWAGLSPADRIEVAPNLAALNKMHRSNLDLDKEEPGERGHISLTFLGNPDAVRIIDAAPKQLEEAG